MKDAIAIEQLLNRLEENLRAHLTFQAAPNGPEFYAEFQAIAVIRALREHIAELEKKLQEDERRKHRNVRHRPKASR